MFSIQVFCYANGAAKDETGHRGNWLLMPVFLLLSQSIVDEWLASPSLSAANRKQTEASEGWLPLPHFPSSPLRLSLRLSPLEPVGRSEAQPQRPFAASPCCANKSPFYFN